jgi:hypothetical protein
MSISLRAVWVPHATEPQRTALPLVKGGNVANCPASQPMSFAEGSCREVISL